MEKKKEEIARNVFIIDAGLASGAGVCGGGGVVGWGDTQGSGKYCFFKKGGKKRGAKGEKSGRNTLGSEEADRHLPVMTAKYFTFFKIIMK